METVTETLVGEAGPVTIARSASAPRRAERRAPDHLQFIVTHWPSLAAAAYGGFQRHGAGAVVLFGDAEGGTFLSRIGLTRRAESFRAHRLWYATAFHAIPNAPRGSEGAWEAAQLEAYDPQREGLVVFVEGRLAPCGYRVGGLVRPPDALGHARASLN